jgi:Fe-S cluster assembly iron-binding protein IscA
MALDESADKLQEINSNGIVAYIDPKVLTYLQQYGDINIDFITRGGQSGYMISVGDPSAGCSPDQCSSCEPPPPEGQ